jgi:hypothetical protein
MDLERDRALDHAAERVIRVSCCSFTSWPLIHTVSFGASPSTRTRTRFQASRFQASEAALGG